MEALSPVKQALLEIRELRAQLAQVDAERHAPVAIVGMGLRIPGGANDPAAFWDLLRDGRDAITEAPADRWDNTTLYDADPDVPGKVSTRFGGFLRDVDQFDADFFGVSRREAESMDPQHRMLLEVTWEALERAAISPDTLANTNAGFFLGIANSDYWRKLYGDPMSIDVYAGVGGALSVAAGRLAYFLGAHGPTLSVDTACSSSLVAIHLACQSLRRGETDLAVAGGVSLILSPEGTINFSKARMMAPDGRCKSFDASADGYVRSDGCAMIVLKRLPQAEADGDRVLAVIRGSAVNQDGRSNGLTAPNGVAQEAVMRQALHDAGLPAAAVQYVEGHGTGTSLGDPIELRAVGAVYGAARNADAPLIIGSVKTNLGHLEAAAGVIGVAKVVQSLRHETIPPHLHTTAPTPMVDWDAMHLRLPRADGEPWVRGDAPRVAAVSSFGFSGTNAHIIISEAAPQSAAAPRAERTTHVLPIAGRTPSAVRTLAAQYADALDGASPIALADLTQTLSVGRTHLKWSRQAVVARDRNEAVVRLRQLAEHGRVRQPGNEARPRIAFLFTGQGAQFTGMARDLYQTAPVVREVLDRCDAVITRELGEPLPEILWGPRSAQLLDDTRYSQPAIIAIELAMASLWRSWGVEPAAVAGHSLGEFAAAAFTGVVSIEDALRLVIARASMVDGIAADIGAMTVVSAPRARVEAMLGGFVAGAVELAADNGPSQIVLTGPIPALTAAESALAAAGIEFRRLHGVRHAFHSAALDAVLPAFERLAQSIPLSAPHHAWVSGYTGTLFSPGEAPSSRYWAQQTRGTVRYHDMARELLRLGMNTFVEVGPHPVLASQVAEIVEAMRAAGAMMAEPLLLPSLRRNNEGWAIIAESVAQLYAAGGDIDWVSFSAPYAGDRVELPTYPFERQRYWLREEPVRQPVAFSTSASRRWTATLRRATAQAAQAPIGVDVPAFPAFWSQLSTLSTALIVDTIRERDVFMRAGDAATQDEAAERCGFIASQRQLLGRWLQRLVREGYLRASGDQFISDVPLPSAGSRQLLEAVCTSQTVDTAITDYVRNCGRLLADVMTGRANALETLFPDGSFAVAEALYTRGSAARYINALAAAAIAPLAEHPPERRAARVLEIGAGTGGTTSALIPELAGSGTEYWFTDVSDTFMGRAHDRFGAQVTLHTAVFDADRGGAVQGVPEGAFDVVTAANAIHAARNLTAALANARALLAPGGFLLLVETAVHHDWFDISTGLIEGWQHFEDDLRHDVPLLNIEAWTAALQAGGFEEVRVFPEPGSPAAALGQHVIVARVPELVGGETESAMATAPAMATVRATANVADERAKVVVSLDRLQGAAPSERITRLQDIVGDAVSELLRRGPDERLDPHDRLMEHGIDSLMAVQLRGALSRGLAIDPPLPATLIFEHPTIDAIARHLLARLFLVAATVDSAPPASESGVPADTVSERQVRAMSDADIAALLEARYGSAPTGNDE